MSVAYDSATVAEARRLRADGWTVATIADAIEERAGSRPAETTVLRWVDATFDEAQRISDRARKRIRCAAVSGGRLIGNHQTVEFRVARITALRGLGLPMSAIAKVMTFDFPDMPLTERQVDGFFRDGTMPRHFKRVLKAAA